uniref:RfbB n=1 Tax=Spirochaeta aurantia TaxID=147 RepID=Q0PHX8_SPIAU|nr:RfbB [Spirochaeta aurantia]
MVGLRQDCERVHSVLADTSAFRKLEGSTIFISGGTGFVGSWVCHYLHYLKTQHNLNFRIYVQGRERAKFDERISILSDLDVSFIRCDIKSLSELPREVNYVIHAAGSPDSRYHASNPIETMADIAEGTRAVLRAADRVSNLRMVVHLSSGSVYGTQPDEIETINENHALARIPLDSLKSAYTEGKRYAEVLCSAARSESRLPIVILRPFTFIGPFQSLDSPWAINNFINDGLRGRPIRILGDGRAIRGFLYGADAAAWVVKVLLDGKSGQIYNVGNVKGESLLEIANAVAGNFSPKPEIQLNSSLVQNVSQTRYLPDCSRILADHGLRAITPLGVAVRRTIEWFKTGGGN